MTQSLYIIADDLTGAMDSSGYLASRGLSITVDLEQKLENTSDIIAITTNSRRDPPLLASQKIKDITTRLKGHILFKKIDSTLRGNIGPELEAMAEVLCCEKIIIAPAFPALGRTVKEGILRINGIPVAETELRHDPLIPLKESFIPSLLKLNARFRTGVIKLADIAQGPEHLLHELNARTEKVLICDTLEQEHLRTIARAIIPGGDRFLLCGSGGLAREIHILFPKATPKTMLPVRDNLSRPVLLVVGSRHPASAKQLLKAQARLGIKLLKLRIEELNRENGNSLEISRLVEEANHYMEKGMSVAITSTFSSYLPDLEAETNTALAEAARLILTSSKPGGLFLSGGDTAMAVCKKINASAIEVCGEIEPGIPAGNIIGWQNGLRLVTKAGAFGGENVIINSMDYLERSIL